MGDWKVRGERRHLCVGFWSCMLLGIFLQPGCTAAPGSWVVIPGIHARVRSPGLLFPRHNQLSSFSYSAALVTSSLCYIEISRTVLEFLPDHGQRMANIWRASNLTL